jgi:flavin reductase
LTSLTPERLEPLPSEKPWSSDNVSIDSFRAGMRRLAGALSLVTTQEAGTRHGLLVSSVTSLSGDPPSLIFGVNQSASSHDPLIRRGVFCVNVLSSKQRGIAELFAKSNSRNERFSEGRWAGSTVPVLLGSLASFECVLDKTISYGSHSIMIGIIKNIAISDAAPDPVLYFDGGYRYLRR